MKNAKHVEIPAQARTELHDLLGLTGCEVSVNTLQANAKAPFLHHHQQNEELYLVISGSGEIVVDGEAIALKQNAAVKVEPAGVRAVNAGPQGMTYIVFKLRPIL